ncbi:MAG: RNA polymerase sigma factor [Pseudomonadota bacterium]
MHDPSANFKEELTGLIPRLRRYALVLLQSESAADDLVQATLLRAILRQRQWQADTRLDAWVFAILRSIWKNDLRAIKVREGNGRLDADEIPDTQAGTGERTFLLSQVLDRVNDLPVAQRESILLVYVEGYSYQEAADVLGVPSGTLMSRLARARVALARSLSAQADTPIRSVK